MLFSLEELESIFGYVNAELVEQIYSDMREIRKSYREKYGFFKAQKVTNKKILRAFVIFRATKKSELWSPDAMNYWDEFVSTFTVDGDFERIKCYI